VNAPRPTAVLITRPSPPAARVSRSDSMSFVSRLVLCAALTATGLWLVLIGPIPAVVVGVLLLAAMFTHAVELQHQCLHHSAFRRSRPHRVVGVLLGMPMLVAYSHYRVRHLHHHRHLGTPKDTEFFGFDARQQTTWPTLLRGLFDYRRLLGVLHDIARSVTGRWQYEQGQISPKFRRHVMQEYRLLGMLPVAALVLVLAGFGKLVLLGWLAPLALAIPLHFLLELPEHLLCEDGTIDVLRNTRSITGSRLATWFTNANNLHIEHHLEMRLPLQRLRERHAAVAARAIHVERRYWDFYRLVWSAVRRGGAVDRG
jgi:fatty acid desaturase